MKFSSAHHMPNLDQAYVKWLSEHDSESLLGALFTGDCDPRTWDGGTRLLDLIQIVRSGTCTNKVRFHALMALLFSDPDEARNLPPGLRAEILCHAREGDFLNYDEFWGRLWDGESLGVLGNMVLICGDAAISPLQKLLGNETERTIYYGSEEATEMALRHYRVKDFAAYYIARIKGYDLPWRQDLAERDAAIAAMRAALGI